MLIRYNKKAIFSLILRSAPISIKLYISQFFLGTDRLDIDFSSQFDEDMAPLINEDNTREATFELIHLMNHFAIYE